jgi:hypothetical protein
MNFFSMMLFHKLFSIYSECSQKHDKESDEYKKCKEIKLFNDLLLQEFLQQNQELLAQYLELLEDEKIKELTLQMSICKKKIDDEIDQYLSYEEQMEFFIKYFNLEELFKEFEFDR